LTGKPNVSDIERARRAKALSGWEAGLLVNEDGNPRSNLANVMHVLANHPEWSGKLAYNDFAETIIKTAKVPTRETDAPARVTETEWTETDSIRTAAWLQEKGLQVQPPLVTQAVLAIAERLRVHPVREWLDSLEWDQVVRLDKVLATYFGADATAYTAAIGTRWMISAVARVYEPGCKADCMIVLESSRQGRFKSSGLQALCERKEWFADTPLDLGSKDGYQSIRRKWIYEIGELDAFKGKEATKIKSFVSAQSDNYRPSYGTRNRDFPRQVVFAGTTNESEYLADRTGNRRFWPVRSNRIVDVAAIQRDRAQLWAEAVHRYRAGERWYVDTTELRQLCEAEQEARTQADPWTPLVAQWLVAPAQAALTSKGVTTDEVLRGALDFEPSRMGRSEETRIGYVMRELQWSRQRVRENGTRVYRYYPAPPDQPTDSEVGTSEQQE
jgi:putative DNA primase/helicase